MLQTFRSALTFRRTQHSNFLQVQQVGNDLEDFNDIETDVLDGGPLEIKDDLQVRTRLIYYYVTANKGCFWLFFGIEIK